MKPQALRSQLLFESGFSHGFFTRLGGYSQAPFDELNTAWSSGDDEARVRRNLALIAADLGVFSEGLIFLSQVHSDIALRVAQNPRFDVCKHLRGDALYGGAVAAYAIRTADCVPVLLASPGTGEVAAVHAGWRGAESQIVRKTLDAWRQSRPDLGRLIAAVGPHISAHAFEVGPEVAHAIAQAPFGAPWVIPDRYPKPHIDLRGWVTAQLRSAGVAAVDQVEGCTLGDEKLFYSYRRDGKKSGRLLSAIVARCLGKRAGCFGLRRPGRWSKFRARFRGDGGFTYLQRS